LVAIELLHRHGVVSRGKSGIELGEQLPLAHHVAGIHGNRFHHASVERLHHGFRHHGNDLALALGDTVEIQEEEQQENGEKHRADDGHDVIGEPEWAPCQQGLAGREKLERFNRQRIAGAA